MPMREFWNQIKPAVRALLRFARAAALAVWSLIRVPVLFVLQVLAALILIFEEWGWKPLSEALARLTRFALWARIEQWIALLPPYGALAVFALPTLVLLPLKFFSVWLLANGFFVTAGALFLAAKVASTAFIARIFLLTKPALMRIGWFARAYNWLMPWKDALFARIRASFAWRYGRMLKNAVRIEVKQAYARWKPWVIARWNDSAPRAERALRTAPERVRVTWRIWAPRVTAELSRWKNTARRAWEKLIGIA
jgi:hypothetical protein